jgi:hypothetical protein
MGAMAMPARNALAPAKAGALAWSIATVVMTIKTDPNKVAALARIFFENCC